MGSAVPGKLVDEEAGEAGRNPGELKVLLVAPVEESAHHTGVRAASVGVGDPGGEEFIGGKERLGAGPLED